MMLHKKVTFGLCICWVSMVHTAFALDFESELDLTSLIQEVSIRNANTSFEVIQYKMEIAKVAYEKGVFEPTASVSVGAGGVNVPNAVQELVSRGFQQNYQEQSNQYQLGVQGLLYTGAQWNLSYNSGAKKSSLINQYRNYTSEYQNGLRLEIRQPLLKGAGTDATMAKIHMSEFDQAIAEERLRQRLMEVLGVTIRTYWQLYGALKLHDSWSNSLKNSEKILSSLKAKVRLGKAAKTEMLQAESAIALRKAELLAAKSKMVDAQNKIFTLLNLSSAPYQDFSFRLPTYQVSKEVIPLNTNESYEKALQSWPNVAIAKNRLERESVSVAYAKNQDKIKLDVFADFSTASLSQVRGTAFQSSFSPRYKNWKIGVELSMPILGDKRGANELIRASLRQQQAELEYGALKKSVFNSLHSKIEELKNSRLQLEALSHALQLKKKLLAVEKIRFHLGKSNVSEVLKQEEVMIDFQRRYFDGLVVYKIAEVSLEVAEGILLEKYGVQPPTVVVDVK